MLDWNLVSDHICGLGCLATRAPKKNVYHRPVIDSAERRLGGLSGWCKSGIRYFCLNEKTDGRQSVVGNLRAAMPSGRKRRLL
jgi:hypothetical protein